MHVLDTINATGHSNIRCTHTSTIELTKENYLTERGTCILGINANKACIDLSPVLKSKIINGEKIKVFIKTENFSDSFYGYGNKNLTLTSNIDMVFRKSNYRCGRTVLINCTKSSNELNKELIAELTNSDVKLTTIFYIEDI